MTWVCEADERAATLRAHEADAIASLTPEDAMKRRLAVSLLTAAALTLALAAGPARAGSATNDLTVTANVVGSCTIAAATLDFSDYDATTDAIAETDIVVSCTNGTTYSIALEGTNADRSMSGGAGESLNYDLFSDAARTVAWDFSTPVSATATSPGPGPSDYPVPVYGRIPAGQPVSPGVYGDVLTMTVNF
jgi:spore coat protein U-like protein